MTHTRDAVTDKEAAVQFLQLVVAGRINDAYARFVDMSGIHHNPHFRAGFAELRQAMLEDHAQFPTKQLQVKHVLGDGDIVAVHSRLVVTSGEPGMVVWHLFRFHDSRIVEMWDCGQPVPADSPNEDGAF